MIHALSPRVREVNNLIFQAFLSWPFGTKPIGLTCKESEIGQGPDMRPANLYAEM